MSTDAKYLFDASAIINILPLIDARKLQTKLNLSFFINQLTPFEVGNALWKLYLRKKLESLEVMNFITLMQEFIEMGIFQVLQVTDFNAVASIAIDRKITYYDASYIHLGKERNMILITDDNGLRTNAEIENVISITTDEFKEKHQDLIKV